MGQGLVAELRSLAETSKPAPGGAARTAADLTRCAARPDEVELVQERRNAGDATLQLQQATGAILVVSQYSCKSTSDGERERKQRKRKKKKKKKRAPALERKATRHFP